MGRLVCELQKEPGVRRDVNQFTCMNSKKTEREKERERCLYMQRAYGSVFTQGSGGVMIRTRERLCTTPRA